MTYALIGLQPVSLDSPNATNAVDGATIVRRIRISRPDEGKGSCKASRAWDPRKDFSQPTQPHITFFERPAPSHLSKNAQSFPCVLFCFTDCSAKQGKSCSKTTRQVGKHTLGFACGSRPPRHMSCVLPADTFNISFNVGASNVFYLVAVRECELNPTSKGRAIKNSNFCRISPSRGETFVPYDGGAPPAPLREAALAAAHIVERQ